MTTSTWAVGTPFNLSGVIFNGGTVTKEDGTAIDVDATGTAAPPSNEIVVGTPAQPYSSTGGIQSGDNVADALQKLDELLVASIPVPVIILSSDISGTTLTLADGSLDSIVLYQATHANTTTVRSNVTDKLIVNLAETTAVEEVGGQVLTLKYKIAGVQANRGSITLTTGAGNDLVTNDMLTISYDADPNPGSATLTGIGFKAKGTQPAGNLAVSTSTGDVYGYELQYNATTTSVEFYVDSVAADVLVNPPAVTAIDFISSVGSTYTYSSGIPNFASPSQIKLGMKCQYIIGSFYNSARVVSVGFDLDDTTADLDDGAISSLERVMASTVAEAAATPKKFHKDRSLPSGEIANDYANLSTIEGNMQILAGKYSENVMPQAICYTSRGDVSAVYTQTALPALGKKLRIDTVSVNESLKRVVSGVAQFPTFNTTALPPVGTFGAAFDSELTLISGTHLGELQMSNNVFHYPFANDYTNDFMAMTNPIPSPGAPDYSNIASLATTNIGTDSNIRWFTSFPDAEYTLNEEDVMYITINDPVNFGTVPIVPNFHMQICVVTAGSPSSPPWFDANSAYDMNPDTLVANGDACLDASVSTATVRKITFGNSPFTGTAYVRIGLPSNEALKKSFSGITVTTTAPTGFDNC
jgi:hypothetical protein